MTRALRSVGIALTHLLWCDHEWIFQRTEIRHPVTGVLITETVSTLCLRCLKKTPPRAGFDAEKERSSCRKIVFVISAPGHRENYRR